jgi:YD repeat-containing protein
MPAVRAWALALALACAAFPQTRDLPCGQIASALLDGGRSDRYRFPAAAGDAVTLRVLGSGFAPVLDLLDPDGKTLVESEARITRRLTRAGNYTIVVRAGSGSPTGIYRLTWQRVNGPCNAVALTCGRFQRAAIDQEGELDAYSFTASAGDFIALHLSFDLGLFVPILELYDPAGTLLDSWIDEVSLRLPADGLYSVLVRRVSGSVATGSYGLVWHRINNPCNNIELTCGVAHTAPLSVPGETDAYTLRVEPGDQVAAFAVTTTGQMRPFLELYDPAGPKLGQDFDRLIRAAKSGGLLTLLVGDSRRDRTGGYGVVWQRLNAPCNGALLACGQSVTGTLDSGAGLAAYTVSVSGGDTFSARAERRSGTVTPFLELWSRAGEMVTSGPGAVSYPVSSTASFTLLVRDATGAAAGTFSLVWNRSNNPCPLVDREGPAVTLLAPRAGDLLLAGFPYTIRWTSFDNSGLASHEIRLSTDGGRTYPTVIASNLAAEAQSFDWAVPAGLSSDAARLRVLARDRSGNTAQADSPTFTLRTLDLPPSSTITYEYDRLNRLVRVVYENGATTTYTYDAAGNRLRVVTAPAPEQPSRPAPPRSRRSP